MSEHGGGDASSLLGAIQFSCGRYVHDPQDAMRSTLVSCVADGAGVNFGRLTGKKTRNEIYLLLEGRGRRYNCTLHNHNTYSGLDYTTELN